MRALIACLLSLGGLTAAEMPENLARHATATATSAFNDTYGADRAIDGVIPGAGSHDDVGRAWAVNGSTHRQGAEFTLTWPEPVTVAEVVYYARNAWEMAEAWQGYRLLDADSKELAAGQFRQRSDPQRITLAQPVVTKSLRFVFGSSYGGSNPGASEIMVFATPAPKRSLPGESTLDVKALAELPVKLDPLVMVQRYPIDSSHVYTYHTEGFRAGGGLWRREPDGAMTRLVDAGAGQILDCDVSPDARTILFSWRQATDQGYHLWTVAADGTGLRQLTTGRWHDYNGCWLPDGGIAFLSTRAARFAYCWVSPVGLLFRMNADGSDARRLSANLVNDFTPSVLNDGRIIYSRWEYVDRPAIPIQSLWTISPDGTGLAGFWGNRVLSPATIMEARAVPGSTKVLCTLTAHNGPARGAIGLIDRGYGDNTQAALTNLTPEIDAGKVDQGSGNHIRGPYATPYPLDDQWYLVSRDGTVLLRDYARTSEAEVVAPRDGMGFHNAAPVRARAVPAIATKLSEPASAGVGGWATMFVEDVYRGLEPVVKRGEVKRIAVVQEMEKPVRTDVANRAFGFQFPVISCGATYAGKKVWGFAPVADDGSAHFQVPAGVPIYFMALDAEGRAVQRMRTFTHLMPGETQGCVGCHEQRTTTTPPRRPSALASPPAALTPPDWGQGVGFDYASVVQPVLDRHCVSCHDGVAPAGGVDLAGDKTDFFNVSYETLARGRRSIGEGELDNPYTSWIPTYNGQEANILEITPRAWGSPRSRLADIVIGGHAGADGQARVKLEAGERQRILSWIDLNVPYYGTSETAYPLAVGCRRIYPAGLDKVLADVRQRRCASCHAQSLPRPVWTRLDRPELNGFAAAPLAKAQGGSGKCGQAVFAGTSDPDYQAILAVFAPVRQQLAVKPRDDMPGAVPDATVCRDAQ
ncbi:MAG: hypothetical protein HZB16_23405 [Armatimonadetes bacterium]|nr:hypothetical protein [Armatimonadota bacterium]